MPETKAQPAKEPLFTTEQRVIDKGESKGESRAESAMRVIDPNVGRACEISIDEDTTVAEYGTNTNYPENDRVVAVVYESALIKNIPPWPDDVSDLLETLKYHREEWNIRVKPHYFPESRLSETPQN